MSQQSSEVKKTQIEGFPYVLQFNEGLNPTEYQIFT